MRVWTVMMVLAVVTGGALARNWERVEAVEHSTNLVTLVSHPSTEPGPAGAVLRGVTVWPTVTNVVTGLEGESWTNVAPAAFARVEGSNLVAATSEELAAFADAVVVLEAAAAAQVELDRQAGKDVALKTAENAFLSLCEMVTGERVAAPFGALTAILDGMMTTDPQTALLVSVKLLGLNAECVREGGDQWWDDCAWHPEIVEGGAE